MHDEDGWKAPQMIATDLRGGADTLLAHLPAGQRPGPGRGQQAGEPQRGGSARAGVGAIDLGVAARPTGQSLLGRLPVAHSDPCAGWAPGRLPPSPWSRSSSSCGPGPRARSPHRSGLSPASLRSPRSRSSRETPGGPGASPSPRWPTSAPASPSLLLDGGPSPWWALAGPLLIACLALSARADAVVGHRLGGRPRGDCGAAPGARERIRSRPSLPRSRGPGSASTGRSGIRTSSPRCSASLPRSRQSPPPGARDEGARSWRRRRSCSFSRSPCSARSPRCSRSGLRCWSSSSPGEGRRTGARSCSPSARGFSPRRFRSPAPLRRHRPAGPPVSLDHRSAPRRGCALAGPGPGRGGAPLAGMGARPVAGPVRRGCRLRRRPPRVALRGASGSRPRRLAGAAARGRRGRARGAAGPACHRARGGAPERDAGGAGRRGGARSPSQPGPRWISRSPGPRISCCSPCSSGPRAPCPKAWTLTAVLRETPRSPEGSHESTRRAAGARRPRGRR